MALMPYGYPRRINVRDETDLVTMDRDECQRDNLIVVLSRTAIYFYAQHDKQLLSFTKRYWAFDEGVHDTVIGSNRGRNDPTTVPSRTSVASSCNNGGNVMLVYHVDTRHEYVNDQNSGIVFGNIALLVRIDS